MGRSQAGRCRFGGGEGRVAWLPHLCSGACGSYLGVLPALPWPQFVRLRVIPVSRSSLSMRPIHSYRWESGSCGSVSQSVFIASMAALTGVCGPLVWPSACARCAAFWAAARMSAMVMLGMRTIPGDFALIAAARERCCAVYLAIWASARMLAAFAQVC